MKFLHLGTMVAVAGMVGAGAAGAADLSKPVYKAWPPAPTWAGFYFGTQTGALLGGDDLSVINGPVVPPVVPPFGGAGVQNGIALGEIDGPTWYQGLYAGYNWQRGNLVYGLEADINSLGPVDSVLGSARVRLGYGTDQFLLYGTAGLAVVSLNGGVGGVFVGGNGGNGGNGGPGGDGGAGGNGFGTRIVGVDGTTQAGFVGGVGAEYRLAPAVGIGVEALYYAFDLGTGSFALPDDFFTVRGRLSFYPGQSDVAGAASAADWSGFYVGGHVGALYPGSEGIGSTALAPGQNGGAGVRGIDGGGGGGGGVAFAGLDQTAAIAGGVHAGYNIQLQNFILGAEADFDLSSSGANPYFGTLRARLGWAGPQFMIYGTAGAAATRSKATSAVFGGNGGNGADGGAALPPPGGAGGLGGAALAFGADETLWGFVIGGGVEAKLGRGMSAGLEALYYGYESASAPLLVPAAGRTFVAGGDSDAFVVRSRLSFALQP
ncbi:hypothetical protein [Xanthobacter sp. KR7-225]|uniref:outer membrane protein n=1 Tax=Xanthobacter sp. KR7-225 TaxID=3156613 RepID=UPI0032B4B399